MGAKIVRTFCLTLLAVISASAAGQEANVTVEEIEIAHESAVPANRGARVQLVARHYRSENSDQGAIIALSSDILPADAGLGLDYQDYNVLEHLAGLGFDVFAADLTGYGHSPKPQMGDGCNAPVATQNQLLMPYPLYIPCEPSYTRQLTSLPSDWAEVDTIVEHVQDLTGDEQVTLVGWSLGSARAAGYAARNPEVVDRLVLIAPRYEADAPAEVPEPYPDGLPLRVQDIDALIGEWQEAVQCDDWAEFEAVSEQLQQQLNELDPVAAEWGYELGSLFRSPGTVGLAGFDRSAVQQISVPTLVVVGLEDTRAAEGQALFQDLAVDDKLRLEIECGTNWLIWEESNETVREVVSEFLRSGTVNGQGSGQLIVARDGTFQ